jgi:KaiC/GvpD/RAD55 family RecA-like ATPase
MSRDPLKRTVATYKKRLWTGWPSFDKVVALRPEIVINVFSTPGIGKSIWALNLVKRVTDPVINKNPPGALYITLDTPLMTQAERWWALHCGVPQEVVEKTPRLFADRTDRMREGHGWVEWNALPVTVDEVRELLLGIKEYTGSYPALVVVDVIKDLLEEGSYEEFSTAFKRMKEFAMGAKITIVTLHHATKSSEPTSKLHLRDVEYTGDKQPDVVLGMYAKDETRPNMLVLKNRSGQMSSTGGVGFRYLTDWDRGGLMRSRRWLLG